MYDTEIIEEREYSDCLYFYHSYMDKSSQWELFPYCVRHANERLKKCVRGQPFTFTQLKQDQIRSNNLLEWNAPVEIVDKYEISYLSLNTVLDDELFCNCTKGYFGPRCEYSFGLPILTEFKDIVYKQFTSRPQLTYAQVNSTNVTCYQGSIGLECDHPIMCLGWRQICDGVFDCANGVDERECLPLEVNECKDAVNEYRCSDGRCIARAFLFDKHYDCMDKTDEGEDIEVIHERCSWEPSIACEEMWNPRSGLFQCGDGGEGTHIICANNRDAIYFRNIFQYDETLVSQLTSKCWNYLLCMSGMHDLFGHSCSFCWSLVHKNAVNNTCDEDMRKLTHFRFTKFCPSNVHISLPVAHFILRFVHSITITKSYSIYPDSICFDHNKCLLELSQYGISTMNISNLTCVIVKDTFNLYIGNGENWRRFLLILREKFSSCVSRVMMEYKAPELKAEGQLFYCSLSGNYISAYRAMDPNPDCLYQEDINVANTCALNLHDVFQCYNEPTQCMTRWMASFYGCNDESHEMYPGICELPNDVGCQFLRGISLPPIPFIFQEICNGKEKLKFRIAGETDETNCDEWMSTFSERNHLCDGVWDVANGSDELNCPDTIVDVLSMHCGPNHHYCARLNDSKLGCLPIEKAGDGIIDCIGASDERTSYCTLQKIGYKCLDSVQCISPDKLCDGTSNCDKNDDENLCPWSFDLRPAEEPGFFCQNGMKFTVAMSRCNGRIDCPSGEDEWLCDLKKEKMVIPFAFNTHLGEYPPIGNSNLKVLPSSVLSSFTITKTTTITSPHFVTSWYCHRGVTVQYVDSTIRCLCPPSYYGTMCQYESDRLSVFIRLTVPSTLQQVTDSASKRAPSLIKIVGQLIVNQKTIYHEQIIDVPQRKHIFYLLFPSNTTQLERNNAYIRFDAFSVTKLSVQQLAAWKYGLPFPFLPVNRLSLDLLIVLDQTCESNICGIHGRCRVYLNSNETYCTCDEHWTGSYCNVTATDCYPNAKCLQSVHRQPICVCPLGRFGSHCFVIFDPCQINTCSYHGQCFPTDRRTTKYACLCDFGYFGTNCEFQHATLSIDFQLSKSIPVGIITFADLRLSQIGILFTQNRVILKNINAQSQIMVKNENQLTVSRFILLDVFDVKEIDHELYIVVLRKNNSVNHLNTQALESNRCPHVDSLLSNVTLPHLTKVKYYAHACHRDLGTKCFYDEAHLCFCDIIDAPDCLVFIRDPNVCDKLPANPCTNNGRCIQVLSHGIWDFGCACPECTYGALCQLTIEQYTLSFDTLFGSEVRPGLALSYQSPLVKICVGIVTCLVFFGLLFNILAFVTFIQPKARDVGVGIYLLILSIVNQLGLFALGVKFLFMLRTQMNSSFMPDHRLLQGICATLDYVLILLLCLSDWLNACVSIERAVNVAKKANFSKTASRRLVKYVCLGLGVFVSLSFLHEPFSRHIVDDPRSHTVWCVKRFRFVWLRKYGSVVNIIHLLVPFTCNVLSASFLLITLTRNKATIKKKTMTSTFFLQFRQHKHLIISPIVLIFLNMPRLILSLMNACTKKASNNIFFISGYFISFLPLLSTFIVFVLPADVYTKVLREICRKICK